MEGKIVYFDKPGKDNTEETLSLASKRADELGIGTIIVATTVGDTAVRASEVFRGKRVIVVTHVANFRGPNTQELTDENRKQIEANGAVVLTAAHAFSGVNSAMRKKFKMFLLGDVIANTLRILGQGMKVVCECTVMAADAGLAPVEEDVMAIAGTGRGADMAVVLSSVSSDDFFDMRVKEILCKPHF